MQVIVLKTLMFEGKKYEPSATPVEIPDARAADYIAVKLAAKYVPPVAEPPAARP